MFPNLLAAVFVISVKIMSAVRISSESKKLNIKLPTNDVFVHSCYIAAAKNIYEDPFVIVDDIKDSEKRSQLHVRFSKVIREIIEDFIPVQQILDTYIPGFTGEFDMDNGVGADTNGEVDEEEDTPPPVTPEAVPETPAEGAEVPGTPATEPVPGTPMGADPSGELKEVPVTPAPGTPAPIHHETLFDDAPDKK
jgi:hypothetical protein